jgi:hypothetical protein
VRPKDVNLSKALEAALVSFASKRRSLPGITNDARREAFVEQIVESIRRIKYVSVIREQTLSASRADPSSEMFDPIKAAILQMRQGRTDEAFWLVFLSVHFGKHRRSGWRLVRDVYGRLGRQPIWDWTQISTDPNMFRQWLQREKGRLRSDGVPRHFGNHRKYQSLDARTPTGTGAAFETYVAWVGPPRTHEMAFDEAFRISGRNPKATFDYLYKSMRAVASFGRTARFDYLTMIGKVGLAPIEPGSTYLEGATGPLLGARLLFGGRTRAAIGSSSLDKSLIDLGAELGVGMQVLEDALCNWQKSPGRFSRFRG